jgi:hypothetical protein
MVLAGELVVVMSGVVTTEGIVVIIEVGGVSTCTEEFAQVAAIFKRVILPTAPYPVEAGVP